MADTTTVGGTTGGYSATGSRISASKPIRTMTIDKTDAKIGRPIKKWENFIGLEAAVAFVEVIRNPGRVYLCAGTDRHQPIDHHPIVGMKPAADDPQTVHQRPKGNRGVLDSVIAVN